MDHVLAFEAALDLVIGKARSLSVAVGPSLPLLEAHGCVLAQSLTADRDQPPFDRSTRDGFALHTSSDFNRKVIGQIRAGELWSRSPLASDQAVEIMTGAPVPPGADAVLMVEHAARSGHDHLTFTPDRAPIAGQNIVPKGSELRAGHIALPAGTRLHASEIAIAASLGAALVVPFRKPRVAILATGDELVELHQQPEPHQIRNSNSYTLDALVTECGGEPIRLPIVPDRVDALTRALAGARGCDLILFSGGVSMGKFDLVEPVLAAASAEFFFTGVRMQPGKPVVFGSLPATTAHPQTFFFGLPGNPISTQVTFLCFVAPLLRALAGETDPAPLFAQATLVEAVAARPGLTRLLPARLTSSPSASSVRLIPWQGSGDLAANARANCYALLPAGRATDFTPGETISILLR